MCTRVILLAVFLSLLVAADGPAARAAEVDLAGIPVMTASANKGRPGCYRVATDNPDYFYWVFVPDTYSPDRPAGLHMFFHGAGGGYRHMMKSFSLSGR
ncbi:MAG: hypothetical protein ACYS5V_16765 [Planctomycetota bacterium]|jgi:hypothetical protein